MEAHPTTLLKAHKAPESAMDSATIQERIEQGVYEGFADVPVDFYNRDRLYVRNSWLGAMQRSPRHCRQLMLDAGSEPTAAMIFGQALHMRVFEPQRYLKEAVVVPPFDGRTKEGKLLRARLDEETARGNFLIPQRDDDAIHAIASNIEKDPVLKELIRGGQAEYSAFWQDEETGVRCKARFDYTRFDADTILDLKSTEDASFKAFRKSVANFGYHRAAAMYCAGASKILGRPIRDFLLIAVEKSEPYEFALYRINDASLEKGEEEFKHALRLIAHCQKTGVWPGYERSIQEMDLPSWYY